MSKKFSNETEFVFSNEFIGFTTIPNYIFQNRQLSFKAVGIYCSILQFQNSPTHIISVRGLMAIHSDRQSSVQSGLNELITHGFLTREQIRVNGMIKGIRYTVHMSPVKKSGILPCENTTTPIVNAKNLDNTEFLPKVDFPHTEIPHMENPYVENQHNKKKIGKKENSIKNKIDDDTSIDPSLIHQFYTTWTSITHKRIKLTDKQQLKLMHLIDTLGHELIFTALDNISSSHYLIENIKPSKFLDTETLLKIYNGEYADYISPEPTQKQLVNKNPYFTATYSHQWDLDELERKEREYIRQKVHNGNN